MPEPTDDEFERMTPAEKAQHARKRANAKYDNPHLERTGDGSGRNSFIYWGLAVIGLLMLTVAAVYSLQGQFSNLVDRGDPKQRQLNPPQHPLPVPGGLVPPNLQPALAGPKPRR